MFTKTVRTSLIILNVFIFAGGATLIVLGFMVRLGTGFLLGDALDLMNDIEYKDMPLGVTLEALSYTSMGFGVCIMVLAIMGICGAWREIKGCMYCYLTSVAFIILMECTLVGIWMAVRGRNNEWLRGQLLKELAFYEGPTATDDKSKGWNDMFMEAHCCGVNDQFKDGGTNSDFTELPTVWVSATDKVPATCCQGVESDTVSTYENSASCTNTPINFYTEGCYDKIKDDINMYSIITIAVCGAIALAQVVAFIAACVAVQKRKRSITPVTPADSVSKPPPYVAIEKWKQYRRERNFDNKRDFETKRGFETDGYRH